MRMIHSVLVLAASALIAACGGGGGGGGGLPGPGPGGDVPLPAVMQLSAMHPAAGSEDAATGATIDLHFDREVNAATLDTSTFSLKDISRNAGVPATVQAAGATARLMPSGGLALATVYEVRLTDAIRGAAGAPFEAAASRFTTRDGTFAAVPSFPATSAGTALGRTATGVDRDGNAITLFRRIVDGRLRVVTNHFSAAAGTWSAAEKVVDPEEPDAGSVDFVSLAVSAGGTAVAVWRMQQTPQSPVRDLWASRSHTSTPGVWSRPVRIEEAPDTVSTVSVATDDAGNAIAAWTQPGLADGGVRSVQLARLDVSSVEWTPPLSLGNGTLHNAAQVLMGANGDGVVIWHEVLAGAVKAKRIGPAGPASGTLTVAEDANLGISGAVAAMAANGDVAVAWEQRVGTSSEVWSTRLRAGQNEFEPPSAVSLPSQFFSDSQAIAMDAAGNTLVAWLRDTVDTTHVYARWKGRDSDQWGPEEVLSMAVLPGEGQGRSDIPAVAMDPAGNAMVTWSKERAKPGNPPGASDIWAARYHAPSSKWREATAAGLGEGAEPTLILDVKGRAMLVWQSVTNGERRTAANRFND